MKAVEDGLKLAKRVYGGKSSSAAAPRPVAPMGKSPAEATEGLPTAVMVYAVIHDPAMVDNPDIPSYQPHVYGRMDPPALIPLQMNGVELEVDCYLDTAFVKVSGSWRVHCVMGSKSCDCLVAIPMGEQVCVWSGLCVFFQFKFWFFLFVFESGFCWVFLVLALLCLYLYV